MPLKDYTTTVDTHRTIGEITGMLVKAGADGVAQEYEAGRVKALTFAIKRGSLVLTYILPIDPEAVRKVLAGQHVKGQYLDLDHCERVAWRIAKDWIAAQLAFIETGMVSLTQVMLPYLRGDGEMYETLYDWWCEQQLPALEAGS
jgi:hypothetical protein